ncbi:TRP-domain-containing protein [Ascobolus immersus RN42]|uniref:TRP-domain-containing protein n=1 Tax=Ascobolus immersus RN42 TaxID=1160509 RepID=A0A3N4IN63_ASCIM|nr:TRP-domain-containing protein [Ascobolus immersus RN42]
MRPLVLLLSMVQLASAEDKIFSRSIQPCMKNSQLQATLLNVTFTPSNGIMRLDLQGITTAIGFVVIKVKVLAYGIEAFTEILDPCLQEPKWEMFCPMKVKKNLEFHTDFPVDPALVKDIPSIAYTMPDLDGVAQITFETKDTGEVLACLEAPISNGKTVEHKAAGWATAIVAGLGLVTSLLLVASGKGRTQSAAHVATYALAFFSYMQAQALVGLAAVPLPPLPQAWTQNFQWSMGLMRLGWMQRIITWWIRATGGRHSTVLVTTQRVSVNIQKRSLDVLEKFGLVKRAEIVKRALQKRSVKEENGILTLRGIDRVGYKAKIETSNIFITALVYFILFFIFGTLVVIIFKYVTDWLVKRGTINQEKFLRFRTKWKRILKSILYQMCLIGYPSIACFSLYEFTATDSPAAVVLAVFYLLTLTGTLAWAVFWILRTTSFSMMTQSTLELEKAAPAVAANRRKSKASRWGILCITYDKEHYYFIAPFIFYILLKSIFVGVAQKHQRVQAVALFVIEILYCGLACYLRPWMDKRTNIVNISIAVVNMLNAVCLMIFSGIFSAPRIAMGVVGVIFFIMNALFSLILVFLVLASTIKVVVQRNKETPNNSARSSMMSDLPNLAAMAENTPLSPNSTESADSTAKPALDTQVYRGLSSRGSNTLSKRSSDQLRREISRSSIATSTRTGVSRRERPPMPSAVNGEHPIPVSDPYYSPANTPPPSHFNPLEGGRRTPVERATSRASQRQGYPFPHTPAPVDEQPEYNQTNRAL